MYIRALQVGLNIGDGYQDYEGFEVEVDIKVIEVMLEMTVDVKVKHVRWTSG